MAKDSGYATLEEVAKAMKELGEKAAKDNAKVKEKVGKPIAGRTFGAARKAAFGEQAENGKPATLFETPPTPVAAPPASGETAKGGLAALVAKYGKEAVKQAIEMM